METPPRSKNPAALDEELRAGLKSFLTLYHLRRDVFAEAAVCLRRAGESGNPASADALAVALLSMLGGGLGAVVGGVAGGLWGGLGAVGAAAYCRICGHVNAVGASVGFFGGTLGGLVGGAFSGTIGCAVEVGFVAWGRRTVGVLSGVLWFSIGCATGGAIGSMFGGSVGAAGGAVGGGFGALHARAVAVYLAAGIIGCSSQGKSSGRSETVKKLQTSLRRFSSVMAPLVEELQSVQTLRGQMESGGSSLGITAQTTNTLAAVRSLQKSLSDCREAAGRPDSAACWEEGARRSNEALEELKKMRVKVETLLRSFTEGETEAEEEKN